MFEFTTAVQYALLAIDLVLAVIFWILSSFARQGETIRFILRLIAVVLTIPLALVFFVALGVLANSLGAGAS